MIGGIFAFLRQRRHATVLALVALTFGGASDLVAQIRSARPVGIRVAPERAYVGLSFLGAAPRGEFSNFIDAAFGIGSHAVINVDGVNGLGIRFDGSFMIHDDAQAETLLVSDIETDNLSLSFGVGPQLTFGRGPIRPFVYGTLGFTYLYAKTTVFGVDAIGPFEVRTDFDDWSFAATGGGGLLFRVSRGRTPVYLTLSAAFVRNSNADYFSEAAIQELSDGSLLVGPVETNANMVQFRAGFSVALR